MKRFLQFVSYILVAAVASCVTMLLFLGRGDSGITKLTQLKELIQSRFIGEVDEKAMEDAAAAAMIDSLGDRWSYYIPAEEYQAYEEQMANAYVGVGITVTQLEDGTVEVMRVTSGGPAEAAGMLPGDLITGVAGQDIAGMDINAVKGLIQGEAGTNVEITVIRGGDTVTMTVERQQIQTVVATGEMLADSIGLVTIVNFDSRCADETIAAIEDLLSQGAKALILDVRYNPGGYKHELVKVLDYLLPEGPLFRSMDYNGKETVDNSGADCLELPMAVLVNGDSYSAAEFFAAALSEYEAAVVVGEPTTGKGYFQSSYQLADGSAAVISVGKYFTPNGVSLANVGLTPDITVEVDDELYMNIYYGYVESAEDPQIQAAIQALKTE